MRVAMNPQMQQLLAVGVPIAALVISLAAVFPAWGRYGDLCREVAQKRLELKKLKEAPLPAPNPVTPAVKDEPGESARFLGQVVSLGQAAGCKFVGLDVQPATTTRAAGMLRAVRSKVEVSAYYPQVRQFLWQIGRADRLYVVCGADLDTRGRPTSGPQAHGPIHATVELERYLIATTPGAPPTDAADLATMAGSPGPATPAAAPPAAGQAAPPAPGTPPAAGQGAPPAATAPAAGQGTTPAGATPPGPAGQAGKAPAGGGAAVLPAPR